MTAPSTFSTCGRIIRMARADAGLLQEGDEPNSEQYADGMMRLNDLANLWQTQGLKLWLQYDLNVPLVSGQATYTLGPSGNVVMTKPTRVLDNGYWLGSNGVKRPISLISRDEYMRLSNTAQTGAVTSFFVDKRVADLAVSFWLVPDAGAAAGSAHLLIQQQVTNLISLTDEMDFPREWFIALRWGLADDICTGQPQAIMDRCQQRASAYRVALEDWDVEDASTKFQPDTQGRSSGAFR